MLEKALACCVTRARLLAILAIALLSACNAVDSSESEGVDAPDLHAFLAGTAPVPGEEGREHYREEVARLSARAAGALRAGLDPEDEESWSPVAERTKTGLLPADARIWQEDGDINTKGTFVPVPGACPSRAPVDLSDLPEEVQGLDLEERAARLACSLDRLADMELRVKWAPHHPRAAIIDPVEGTALINPRLLLLVEPDPRRQASGLLGADDAGGMSRKSSAGEPGKEPLNHPRPPSGGSGGSSGGSSGSSSTVCDRVCDDIWNDLFKCDCDNSLGQGNCNCDSPGGDSCDCGSTPGSSGCGNCGSSGGGNSCRCGTARHGAQDRAGVFMALFVLGTMMLRRRGTAKRLGAARRRRPRRGAAWLLVLTWLLLLPAQVLAAPPKLVDVHITVTPAEAVVFMDGNAVKVEGGIARVPAGAHTFTAKLEGYADATQAVEVTAGGTGTVVTLRLTANQGYLVITGRDPTTALYIDGKQVGIGSYSGLVPPGNRVITATDSAGRSRSYVVTAIAGQSITVSVDAPPNYFPPPQQQQQTPPPKETPKPDPVPEKPREPPQKGPYAMLNVTMVWQTGRPYGFEHKDAPAPGFAVGGRGGYRFNDIVGLEALVEYGRIANGGVVAQYFGIDQNGDGSISGGEGVTDRSPADYILESMRFGPVLRLTSTGRVNRFAGGVGLGALHEQITLNHADLAWDAGEQRYVSQGTFHHSYEGWSPYLLFEGGYERSIQNFLMGVLVQFAVESVSGIGGDPYNSGVQARLGLSFRGGYSLW